jgi:serine/threonine protein kinase
LSVSKATSFHVSHFLVLNFQTLHWFPGPALTLIFFPQADTLISIDIMSEVLEPQIMFTAEKFSTVDGVLKYHLNTVLYRLGEAFYVGSSRVRYRSKEEVNFEDIFDSVLIPEDHLSCPFPEHFTRAPDPLPSNCYVKRPFPLLYNLAAPNALGDSLLEEATIYENLVHHPHPNIAKYYGCQVKNNRVTGLCFVKYHESLMKRVNPGHNGKRWFDATKRPLKDMKLCLDGIGKGLEHLHSLGLVHNDLNPSNIMFPSEDDDTPIIIDFGSCKSIGDSIDVGRTEEWYDEKVTTSLPSNDTDALNEITEWLRNGKNFKFEMWC